MFPDEKWGKVGNQRKRGRRRRWVGRGENENGLPSCVHKGSWRGVNAFLVEEVGGGPTHFKGVARGMLLNLCVCSLCGALCLRHSERG